MRISVPPKSASMAATYSSAADRDAALEEDLLSRKRGRKSVPKPMMLKREPSGSAARTRSRAFWVCAIFWPRMEPERSTMKINSAW